MSDHPVRLTRREAIKICGAGAAIGVLTGPAFARLPWQEEPLQTSDEKLSVKWPISLAQWSLHRTIRSGDLDPIDFAKITAEEFKLDAVEYVSTFYRGKAEDETYLKRLKGAADKHGVKSLLIMVDGEGRLGDADPLARQQAVKNHHKWVKAAKFLGCHAIRVNAASSGTWGEQVRRAAEGLGELAQYGADQGISIVVENHGGLSSNGAWLSEVMSTVDDPNLGTLPDFGNFLLSDGTWYDRYKGVEELMPYAKAVSAKSRAFGPTGEETTTDYERMMGIIDAAGYTGYIGIEYEGSAHTEKEGILKTKALLERVGAVAVTPSPAPGAPNSESPASQPTSGA